MLGSLSAPGAQSRDEVCRRLRLAGRPARRSSDARVGRLLSAVSEARPRATSDGPPAVRVMSEAGLGTLDGDE